MLSFGGRAQNGKGGTQRIRIYIDGVDRVDRKGKTRRIGDKLKFTRGKERLGRVPSEITRAPLQQNITER